MIPQYRPIYGELEAELVYNLIKSGSWLSEFEKTKEFEEELAKICDAPYVSCVNNGTIAISIALMALKYPFKETLKYAKVLLPNITMIATATACEFVGADVVFGDVDEFGCLDVNKAIEKLNKDKSITDVIYVTLNGRIDVEGVIKLKKFCEKNHIGFIKDDAQSLGSYTHLRGVSLQSKEYGDIHTLSFSPHKLVSCGQGGAIVTHSKELYDTVERLKDFGRLEGSGGDKHDYYGINSKFSEIQATLGLCQLKNVDEKIKFKRNLYELYYVNLKSVHGVYMKTGHLNWTPWFVDVYVHRRTELMKHLKDNGIQTREIYPRLSEQKIYKDEDSNESYPMSECIEREGLWLPSSFDLKDEEVLFICNKIKEFYEHKK